MITENESEQAETIETVDTTAEPAPEPEAEAGDDEEADEAA